MRLLLAEDEKELSDALIAVLVRNNYSVDVVYNGKEALDYLQTQNYDGVILDVMMPEIDGFTVLSKIRAITRRRLEAATAVWHFGNVSLDSATFTLSVGTKKMRLPNKEYQMLELLLANPGQVISTELFMEKIWGYDTEAEIGVVWVYISYLRKRLQKMGANILIRAMRNQGYFLEEILA